MTVFLNPSLALVQLPFKSVNDRQNVRDENPTWGEQLGVNGVLAGCWISRAVD